MKGFNNKAVKGLLIIVAIIIVMAALSRIMTSSETLSEYAAKHPELQVSTSADEISSGVEGEK